MKDTTKDLTANYLIKIRTESNSQPFFANFSEAEDCELSHKDKN